MSEQVIAWAAVFNTLLLIAQIGMLVATMRSNRRNKGGYPCPPGTDKMLSIIKDRGYLTMSELRGWEPPRQEPESEATT